MKLIHIGDLHLGKTFHKISIIEDQRYVLDQIVGLMKEQKANIVIAGDVFDSANPSLEAQELFLEFVKQVRTVCNNLNLHCWIIIGNHDSARRLLLFKEFLFPEITIIDDCLTTIYDGVSLSFLSFVKPSSAEMKFGKDFNNYSEAFSAYLADMPIENRAKTVLVTHQTFEGCTTGHSETMSFFDDAIILENVKAFPLVLAAHIHKKQKVGSNVYYCGSLLPYAFGDTYTYDVRIWDITADNITYTDYPINVLHDLQIIKGNLKHCLSVPDTGAFVKVELIDELVSPEFAINELKSHFANLVTVISGVQETWDVDFEKPTAQFASIPEAIDSFCDQLDTPRFSDSQKLLIEECLNENINS